MTPKSFYFSTPMTNPEEGLPHPNVAITCKRFWDSNQRFEQDSALDKWMRKRGFGELMPNFYQVDTPELMTCEAVKQFLENAGMTHNAALDQELAESFIM